MNGPSHYREAEAILNRIVEVHEELPPAALAATAALAQVHATLALAAATALHPREALTTAFRDQVAAPWVEVAG